MFKKIFLILFTVILVVLTPKQAFACDNFDAPASVVAEEAFSITVQNAIKGYGYTLYSIPQGGSYNPRSLPPTASDPKLAEDTTITFSGKIQKKGIYKLWVSGTNRVSGADQCEGKTLIQVTGRWGITGANTCTEIPFGGFKTKEECEATISKLATPTPPPPPCGDGKICPTAFGDIQTDPSGFIKSIFGIILSLSGGVAIVLTMIAGYRLMSSQGNPEKVQQAREQLTSAIVGLLFIIFSVTILQIIGVDILHIPGLTR